MKFRPADSAAQRRACRRRAGVMPGFRHDNTETGAAKETARPWRAGGSSPAKRPRRHSLNTLPISGDTFRASTKSGSHEAHPGRRGLRLPRLR